MPPEPDHVSLVIDRSAGLRILRKVGPSAWIVLEGLAMRTTPTSRGHQAHTNVRDLATELGVSKDTVARAVNKLIDAKVIRRSDFAQDEAGRFTTRIYRVDLAKAGLQVLHDGSQPDSPKRDKDDRPIVGAPRPLCPPPPPPPPPSVRPRPPVSPASRRDGHGVPHAEPRPATPAPTDRTTARERDAHPTLFGDS